MRIQIYFQPAKAGRDFRHRVRTKPISNDPEPKLM
jgi:hypothetical protein